MSMWPNRHFCNIYLLQYRPDIHIDHLFMDLFKVTPHPIVFNGFLWKY